MKTQEIYEKLRQRFAEAVGEWQEPKAGDPFIAVKAEALHEVCKYLRDDEGLGFDFLRLISAVDFGDHLASVYHLFSYRHVHEVVLHVDLPKENPVVASVAGLWPAADWHEREAFDMMGIRYEGHPDLRRILLPLDWEGHPLRKEYQQPAEYHGVKND